MDGCRACILHRYGIMCRCSLGKALRARGHLRSVVHENCRGICSSAARTLRDLYGSKKSTLTLGRGTPRRNAAGQHAIGEKPAWLPYTRVRVATSGIVKHTVSNGGRMESIGRNTTCCHGLHFERMQRRSAWSLVSQFVLNGPTFRDDRDGLIHALHSG